MLCTNILLSQVNSFPYTESFEQSFNTGSNVDFIINWKGNTVAASNRIFAGSDPRTGNQSLNIIPTSSFKGTTEISLNLSEINNPKISFYAFSKQNGSSTSSRPILLSFSTSIDGGVTYTTPVPIGDATTFPNNDSTAYAQYTYELPAEASGIPNVIVKMVAERGSGLGSSAELVIDDFLIESQVLPLALTSAKAETHRTVLLKFNQAIIKASAENSTNYTIDNGITIGEALLIDPNTVQLLTSTLSNGPYEVAAFGIGEASTNTLSDTLKASFSFIEPLQVIALSIIDKQTIELEFNLDLDTAAAKISDYYSISPDIGHPLHIALDESIKSKITLSLAEPLEEETYVLVMNGLRDKSALAFAENLRVSFNYLPLGVSELSVVSATEIELTFNQKIEDSSAQLLANYGFNFDIQPILLSKSDSLINIRLNRPLVNNTYTISINNVTNLSGNAKAESLQVPFKYETATLPRQLIINEIFADPSGDHEPDPTVLPNESNDEYIELLNNTPNTINLKGFQLSGGTIGDFVVGPFDYMILTANSNLSLFQAFGGVAGVSSWNSLSNNGEQIILTDNLGNIVDSLTYDKSWYQSSDKAIDLIIAAEAKPRDIVINEILFNPKSGGARFVEIYNNSTNYINLSGWSLAGLTNSRILTEENLFMPPSTYYTITNDASVLSSQYPNAQSDTFIKLTSMPSLPSDEGQVSLINPSQIEIDAFSYNEDYHSPLLSDLKGISLERIKFSGQSEDPNNWFSASSTEYSATPGYENSQSRSREVQTGEISVAPLVFSPESSNGANFVTINYSFQTPGNTLNIKIVDAEGRMILELGQNVIAGKEGFLTWNGTTHQGSKARIGYYMVLLEIISPTGEIRYSKNKVVVGTQF